MNRTEASFLASPNQKVSKLVGLSLEGILDANRHEFEWQVDSLPSGTYFLRLQNRGEFVVEQMVVK